MKKFCICLFFLVYYFLFNAHCQTAEIIKRPVYIDISNAESRSAVLIRLSGYLLNDVRYRLYNGSVQYYCWNPATETYVTSSAYLNGPQVPGEPVSVTKFWIPFVRGNNISVTANYRDRLGPEYNTNYQTAMLPCATEITSPFSLTGKLEESAGYPLSAKYIILAWSGLTLVSASHSDPGTGNFSIVCPASATIELIEVKTIADELVGAKSGSWPGDNNIGTITLSGLTKIGRVQNDALNIYPVPAGDVLRIEGNGSVNEIGIFDLTGRKIFTSVSKINLPQTVSMSCLPPGIYLIKIATPEGPVVKKIVKR